MAKKLFIENAQITFKNFSGRETQYTDEGVRSFSVILEDQDLVQNLIQDGWNVKQLRKQDEDDPQKWHLPVAVSYRKIPPRIEIITEENKDRTIPLDEAAVGELDFETVLYADIYISPSTYISRVTNQEKVKAYLRSMVACVEADPISRKYGRPRRDEV